MLSEPVPDQGSGGIGGVAVALVVGVDGVDGVVELAGLDTGAGQADEPDHLIGAWRGDGQVELAARVDLTGRDRSVDHLLGAGPVAGVGGRATSEPASGNNGTAVIAEIDL